MLASLSLRDDFDMDLALIGLERSGKSTVFDGLSGGRTEEGRHGKGVNVGVARVPDLPLEKLGAHFKSRKTTPAEIRLWDFPGAGFSKSGPSPQFLSQLSQADALLHVVRAFSRPDVPHPDGAIDPHRDVAAMDAELAFADLTLVERRLERLTTEVRTSRADERQAGQRELTILEGVKKGLEQGLPLRQHELTPSEWQIIAQYRFLTAKPLLLVINIGEESIPETQAIEREFQQRYAREGVDVAVLCARVEMELAQLPPEEAAEFRPQMGLAGSGLDAVIQKARDLTGLITFYTAGEPESRAWMIPKGSNALKAAGKIHSDLERGFIRAEVVSWEGLLQAGAMPAARKEGLVSTQGKSYIVRDGDVLLILFNV